MQKLIYFFFQNVLAKENIIFAHIYHDCLHVVTDWQIGSDLDDGVLVNYAKLGNLLAKLK